MVGGRYLQAARLHHELVVGDRAAQVREGAAHVELGHRVGGVREGEERGEPVLLQDGRVVRDGRGQVSQAEARVASCLQLRASVNK